MAFKQLKLTGKISRHILKNLVFDKAEVFYIEDHRNSYQRLNISKCKKCSNYNTTDCLGLKCLKDNAIIPCSKDDDGAILSYSSTAYVVDTVNLTRCQKLVYMYYHFCNINNEGLIHILDENEMAKDLNISLVSLRSANNFLQDSKLISTNRIGVGLIEVLIENYFFSVKHNTTIRKTFEGDTLFDEKIAKGFYELSLDWFMTLITSIKSHNHLRILLFKTCKFLDSKALKVNRFVEDYSVTCSLLEYKTIIKGNYSRSDIITLITEPFKIFKKKGFNPQKEVINNLFISKISKSQLDSFYLIDKYRTENVKKAFHLKFTKKIINLLSPSDTKDTYSAEFKDYEFICRRYGIESVRGIIEKLISKNISLLELIQDRAIIVSELKNKVYLNAIHRLRKPIYNDEKTFLVG